MTVEKIDGMVDTNLISRFVSEWKNSGMKGRGGKPDFSFECVGLKEGVKLYHAGSDKPIGEVAKRPMLVKTNRVLIYGLKEFATLQEAEYEFCKSIGKSKKFGSCTGWRFFRVRFSKGSDTKDISIRGLWDLYPDIQKGIELTISEQPKPAAAKPAKQDQKLIDENKALQDQLKALQDQLNKLSSK